MDCPKGTSISILADVGAVAAAALQLVNHNLLPARSQGQSDEMAKSVAQKENRPPNAPSLACRCRIPPLICARQKMLEARSEILAISGHLCKAWTLEERPSGTGGAPLSLPAVVICSARSLAAYLRLPPSHAYLSNCASSSPALPCACCPWRKMPPWRAVHDALAGTSSLDSCAAAV